MLRWKPECIVSETAGEELVLFPFDMQSTINLCYNVPAEMHKHCNERSDEMRQSRSQFTLFTKTALQLYEATSWGMDSNVM